MEISSNGSIGTGSTFVTYLMIVLINALCC